MILFVLTLITGFQLILFSIIILTDMSYKNITNRILAAFFLAHAVPAINVCLLKTGSIIYKEFYFLLVTGDTFAYLWGPLLFLYVLSFSSNNKNLPRFYSLHFIPFALYLTFMLSRFIVDGSAVFEPEYNPGITIMVVRWMILQVSLIGYSLAAFSRVFSFKRTRNSKYSYLPSNIPWLKIIVLSFGSAWFLQIVRTYAGYFLNDKWYYTIEIIAAAILFMGVNVVYILSLRQSKVLSSFSKYASSSLTEKDITIFTRKLHQYMDKERPYLIPILGLDDLAKTIGVAPKLLSQIINQGFNKNYNQFINEYRIDLAKEMITSDEKSFNILDVAYEVGFNSKSSFNSAFKQVTGMTPREYKKSYSTYN